ncbi:MAG: hypothetical protein KGQ87_03870 [Verrucomicrobia bacterium]|nr:hypothetical protein [Verrucomicrobiota bacterium]
MAFDPTKYDDHTLIESIKSLRHSRSAYLGSWGQKRLATLEREANRRKLQLPKHTQSHDRDAM